MAGTTPFHLRGEVLAALQQGRIHELLPFAGESAGLVQSIVPAGETVQRLVTGERSRACLASAAVPGIQKRAGSRYLTTAWS